MADVKEGRSIGELFSQLASDTSSLVRQEVRLAKLELGEKAAQFGKQVGLLALGGGVAYAGLLTIIAALVLLLGQYMPFWLSALVIGVAVMVIGYYVARQQMNALKHLDPTPTATIETLKEDKEWAKEQLR